MYISYEIVDATAAVCVILGLPLSIGFVRRMGRASNPPSLPAADIVARLDRMEQGIDAIATEVERISEGQRFTTRMLNSSADEKERIARSTT